MTSPTSRRLEGRIAVITGASRGIGAATAKRFAAEGAHLVLVARTVGGLEEIDDEVKKLGGSATLCPFDLTDYAAIDRLGAAIFERWKKLDILIANAGLLGTLTPLAHIRPQEWDQVLAVNLTANWRLIRSLDPLLRASPSGRAIFVTSGAAQGMRAYWGTYAVSKAALEMLATTYAAETQKTNLRVNLIDPGRIRTGMRAAAYPGEDPKTLPPPEHVTDLMVELASPDCTKHGERITVPGMAK
ncbi:MAG TPA: SDR family NAD(P)-dependent oxidoreductase [Hypericibacter adhaerens]|uniref:SDR family NAD(P)-dependent oxidoreductase n=1 Tax=Hypericibacter adhaerens TaxID=2602016 RepID=UPI002CA23D99|nr:SDR family NAD(P)-dependent oxidoreductase [Hypericibacter adhaerens]HWA44666.1 SDR family NAD(P)-dependent oxidoreductase [Hypericibacter adhaerens]